MIRHFLLTAYDYDDAEAYQRRMDTREEHLSLIAELKEQNKVILGAALIDDKEKMIGSSIFFVMSQAEFDDYLSKEPYIIKKVWQKIDVKECKIAPSFVGLLNSH